MLPPVEVLQWSCLRFDIRILLGWTVGLPDIGDGEERAQKQRAPESERGLDAT